jgi:hypothetical protein
MLLKYWVFVISACLCIEADRISSEESPRKYRRKNSEGGISLVTPAREKAKISLGELSELELSTLEEDFGRPPTKNSALDKSKPMFILLPAFEPQNLISFSQYILLCTFGLYLIFFSNRDHRITVIIFGFFSSYFFIAFTIVQFELFLNSVLEHQFLQCFMVLVFGFATSMLTNIVKVLQKLIVGFALSASISLFVAQFYLNFSDNKEWLVFIGFSFVVGLIFSGIINFMPAEVVSLVGSFFGASVFTIYVGVMKKHIICFEEQTNYLPRNSSELGIYMLLTFVITITGLCVQFIQLRMAKQRTLNVSFDSFNGSWLGQPPQTTD